MNSTLRSFQRFMQKLPKITLVKPRIFFSGYYASIANQDSQERLLENTVHKG